LFVTFCCRVYVCYFVCSIFACNPVRFSLKSVKGNLLTYLLTYLFIVTYRLYTVTKMVTLNDLERCNSRYFALFYRIRGHWGTITSVGHIRAMLLLEKHVAHIIQCFPVYNLWRYSQRPLQGDCVKRSENSTCATFAQPPQ